MLPLLGIITTSESGHIGQLPHLPPELKSNIISWHVCHFYSTAL